jgi:hypothetical protein
MVKMVIMVIRNVIISASDYEGIDSVSDYEGIENEIAVKMMAIQRMTPSSSAQLFPFVRWRRE